jgi:hypothetical protein
MKKKETPEEQERRLDREYRRRLAKPHKFGTFVLPANVRIRSVDFKIGDDNTAWWKKWE